MSKRAWCAIAATCGVLVVGLAQAQTLTVEISRDNLTQITESQLRDAVGGAPLAVIARGAKTTIETDSVGYKRLLADETIHSVRLVGGVPDTKRASAGDIGAIEFKVRLLTGEPGAAGAALEGAAAANATHAARLVSRRSLKETLPPQSDFGPGKLLVRGLDGAGREVTRSVIDDPRLVRYEARGADQRITGRRDFYRRDVELSAMLPARAGIASLSIVGPDQDGGQKELARVPLR